MRQSVAATSSSEAEFIAAVTMTKHANHLHAITTQLGIPSEGPTLVHSDAAINNVQCTGASAECSVVVTDQFIRNYGCVVVATGCYWLWWIRLEVRVLHDTILVDAHIFQHSPAEIGLESYLWTVLHVSHRLNQLHSYGLKTQFFKAQCLIPAHIHRLWLLDILLTNL